jgi:hypothetical protein
VCSPASLITSQEDERQRIARELTTMAQRLSLLVDLGTLGRRDDFAARGAHAPRRPVVAGRRARRRSAARSHELHPAMLTRSF